jgi:hypothetical protein
MTEFRRRPTMFQVSPSAAFAQRLNLAIDRIPFDSIIGKSQKFFECHSLPRDCDSHVNARKTQFS